MDEDASRNTSPLAVPGLTDAEVEESRRRHGANVLTPPPRDPWWKLYLEKFEDPIIRVLLVAAVVALVAGAVEGHFAEGLGIVIAIFLSTLLAFVNEYKAGREFDILNRVADDEAVQVVRNGRHGSIPKRDVVVGDILALEQGEEIPADAEVVSAVSFLVNEASLTGESFPVRKRPADGGVPDDVVHAYPPHRVLRGTFVSDGHALARVVSVGDASEIGKTARASAEDAATETPLNKQLARLSQVIGVCGFGIAVLLFAALTARGAWRGEWVLDGGQWYFLGIALAALAAVLSRVWLPVAFDAAELAGRRGPKPEWVTRKGGKPWLQAAGLGVLAFAVGAGVGILAGWLPSAPEEWFPRSAGLELLRYFMVAVTVIVVAVPEGLPMSVTLSLAYSMRKMTASNNLVRRMHACETIGAATVICSDKTGTLTQNLMTVRELVGYPRDDAAGDGLALPLWREAVAANTTAHLGLDAAGRKTVPLGNPTEGALLRRLAEEGVDYEAERGRFAMSGQLTFSTERKYMATLGRGLLPGGLTLHVKGAPEIVLSRCAFWHGPDGAPLPLTDAEREELGTRLRQRQSRALRTLGFAYRVMDPAAAGGAGEVDGERLAAWAEEKDLVWLGFSAVADPVRPEVPPAIAACAGAGVGVKIVTGDNAATAREIAREIGLWDDDRDGPEQQTTGDAFMAMDDETARRAAGNMVIMSRARPLAKQRLVNLLQQRGEVVAVTGDGTNDAPALNHADVGLAMGVTGTSVAKEAADIILLDDSFASIVNAVMWGRSLYANIQKFILFQLTINVAALGIALLGPFLGIKLPLTVTQMLWVNLIMDTFAALALASEPPDPAVMNRPPRKASAFIVTPPMARFIFGMAGLFIAMFLVLVLGFGDRFPLDEETDIGRHNLSIFFSVFVFLQFWNLFNARMLGRPVSAFSGLGESKAFLLIAAAIAAGQILLTQFGGDLFRTTPLSALEWVAVIGGTSVLLWVGEAVRLVRRMRRAE